jgi:hypothetical protein
MGQVPKPTITGRGLKNLFSEPSYNNFCRKWVLTTSPVFLYFYGHQIIYIS